MSERERYAVFVDEAGDRGWGGRSSPVFVLSAAVVRERNVRDVYSGLNTMNVAMGRPGDQELHWAENVREHSDRKMVARKLGEMDATYLSVILCKDSLKGTETALHRSEYQYNYLVRRLLERVSWFVDDMGGQATLNFAHVKRFKYDCLYEYLGRVRWAPDDAIRWHALANGTRPKIEQPKTKRGLQVADLVAGSVYSAVRTDRHGQHEPAYLAALARRLYTGKTHRLTTYGLNFVCGKGHFCAEHLQWLPEMSTACA